MPIVTRHTGPRFSRAPCPPWWVDAVIKKLDVELEITRKELAARLRVKGLNLSEAKILRCIHPDEQKRIPTLAAMDAISDELSLPRPVVMADSETIALALQGTVLLARGDADRMKIAAGVPNPTYESHTSSVDTAHASSDGARGKHPAEMGNRGPKAGRARPASTRRAP